MSSLSLCLVEDDPTISEIVSRKLRSKGFDVDVYEQAEAALSGASAGKTWDLCVLDILLSGRMSGLQLCRELRDRSPTLPILILSALSEPSDRIEGLRGGADDYLSKPFEMEELLLRIEGMLKRRSWYSHLPKDHEAYRWADCGIDFVQYRGERSGREFALTQKECMLMKLLIERESEVVSRDEILDTVWGYNVFPSTRTVDNFILRLRKLFEADPRAPKYLHSVRGMGYKFTK